MKPKNFPERKRQRQLRALARLRAVISPDIRQEQEIETLEQRTAQPLRDVRTKKRRGG
jgi:hypothetical protein